MVTTGNHIGLIVELYSRFLVYSAAPWLLHGTKKVMSNNVSIITVLFDRHDVAGNPALLIISHDVTDTTMVMV